MLKSYKNICKPESHSGASKTFEKCLGPSGTPKSLLEVYKSIYILERQSGPYTTS